jgi:hypothetical protein
MPRSRIPGYRFIGRTKDDLWGKWVIDDGHYSTPEQRHQWQQERIAKRQLRQQHEQQRRAAALPAPERDRHYRGCLPSSASTRSIGLTCTGVV